MYVRLWDTWSGGNDYAWADKGPWFESNRTFSKNYGGLLMSAFALSA